MLCIRSCGRLAGTPAAQVLLLPLTSCCAAMVLARGITPTTLGLDVLSPHSRHHRHSKRSFSGPLEGVRVPAALLSYGWSLQTVLFFMRRIAIWQCKFPSTCRCKFVLRAQ